MATYRDLSPFFREVWVVRHSSLADRARPGGVLFSIFAVVVDALRLPQFLDGLTAGPFCRWLNIPPRDTSP